MRQAEETLRIDIRGAKDYVPFDVDLDFVVRLRNVSSDDVVFAAPGTATAPDGTPLSTSVLVLKVTRRDIDVTASELSRTWSQTVPLQRPGDGAVTIPPGGRHVVRVRIPAADSGRSVAGLRVFQVDGILRPSGMKALRRDVSEPVRVRPGRVVALPGNFEPIAADPLGSLERAIPALAPVHLLLAAEFVPREGRGEATRLLARALSEGDPGLRTAAVAGLRRVREHAVGSPLAPLAEPLVAALLARPERAEALVAGLEALTGAGVGPDPLRWGEWWRSERTASLRVTDPAAEARPERSRVLGG
jgi:hypothetical protein